MFRKTGKTTVFPHTTIWNRAFYMPVPSSGHWGIAPLRLSSSEEVTLCLRSENLWSDLFLFTFFFDLVSPLSSCSVSVPRLFTSFLLGFPSRVRPCLPFTPLHQQRRRGVIECGHSLLLEHLYLTLLFVLSRKVARCLLTGVSFQIRRWERRVAQAVSVLRQAPGLSLFTQGLNHPPIDKQFEIIYPHLQATFW